jgi:hypothetical protein
LPPSGGAGCDDADGVQIEHMTEAVGRQQASTCVRENVIRCTPNVDLGPLSGWPEPKRHDGVPGRSALFLMSRHELFIGYGFGPAKAGRNAFIALMTCILLWRGVACARSPQDQAPPPIVTSDDFVQALRQVGAEVRLDPAGEGPFLEVPARAIVVDGVGVLTYEYASEADRQAVSGSISMDMTTVGGKEVTWSAPPKIWATGRLIVAYTGSDGGTILVLNSLLGDPLRPGEPEVDEPYPPAVAAAIEALASKLAVDPASIEVADFETMDWPDACLGLSQAGELCAESVTPGWRVDLLAAGKEYEAHTDLLGSQVRLK